MIESVHATSYIKFLKESHEAIFGEILADPNDPKRLSGTTNLHKGIRIFLFYPADLADIRSMPQMKRYLLDPPDDPHIRSHPQPSKTLCTR